MPAIILSDNGATSGSAGLKTSGGNDGVLQLQTTTSGGTPTTAISISNTQVVTFTNQPTYTGGTANGVLYLNGSKAVTSGTALVFDGTNLGVGTASPNRPLTVNGVLNLTDGSTDKALSFYSATYGYVLQNTQAGPITLWTNGSERARIDSSGNLGLGVTPSTWTSSTAKAFQVAAGGLSGSVFAFQSGVVGFANNYYNNSGDFYAANGYATRYYQYLGQHIWNTAGSGTAGGSISFSQPMTLDANGRLLVGLTSATGYLANLTVSRYNVTSSPIITWTNATSNSGHCHVFATGSGITSDGYLAFGTNELGAGTFTERMRISTAGVVTQPAQPFVAAYRSGDLTGYNQTSQTLVTVFNATEQNIGSHYSTSTGLLTAPASGVYLYYTSAYTGGPSTLSQVWTVQNGSRGRSSRVGVANDVVTGTGTIYLSSGDTFGVHFYGSDTNSTISANAYHTFLYIYFLG